MSVNAVGEWPSLLHGAGVTLQVVAGVLAFGFLFGMGLALAQVFGPHPFALFATAVERMFRGIPAIVLLLVVYYLPWDLPPLLVAIVALGLCSSGYQSQIFRTAFRSVKPSQVEAGRALGLTNFQVLRHVVLPQALRLALPSWANEFSAQIKETSLVYIVGVAEILRRARYIVAYTFGNSLLIYGLTALIYFALTRTGTAILLRLARRVAIPGLGRPIA